MTSRERLDAAANRTEELAAELKRAVTEIRETDDISYAYARLYHLRTELGRVVATLGVGVPRKLFS